MGKIKLTILLFLTCQSLVFAQAVDRYAVFFTDKANSAYSTSNPEAFLTAKAIGRKGRVISEEDLPVNAAYLSGVSATGATMLYALKWNNATVVQATTAEKSLIEGLSYVSKVEMIAPGAQPDPDGRIEEDGGKSSESSKMALVQNEILGVPALHADGFMGEGMNIAVFDGGFDKVDVNNYFAAIFDENRMIMGENIVTGSDDVYAHHYHGSNCLSTIAANIENSYVGVAPNANFYLFVTEHGATEYRIEEYNWARAAEIADSAGVDVISSSLGYNQFDDSSMDYTHDDLDGATAVVTIAAEKAFEKGMFVVGSAGNEGNKSWVNVTPPADGRHVLAVGAIDNDLALASFSSRGPVVGGRIKPDVVAVGEKASLVSINGVITTGNGTSYSAPQVAGLVAAIWQKYPDYTNQELFDKIIAASSQAFAPNSEYGYGIPNYLRFTNIEEGVTAIDPALGETQFKLYPNPIAGNALNIEWGSAGADTPVQVVVFSPNGQVQYRENITFTAAEAQHVISINNWTKGMFIVQIISDEIVYTYKVVNQ